MIMAYLPFRSRPKLRGNPGDGRAYFLSFQNTTSKPVQNTCHPAVTPPSELPHSRKACNRLPPALRRIFVWKFKPTRDAGYVTFW
jgi:hypothetical protein